MSKKLINIVIKNRQKVNTNTLRTCPDCGNRLFFDNSLNRFRHITDFCCYQENEYGICVMNNDKREKEVLSKETLATI